MKQERNDNSKERTMGYEERVAAKAAMRTKVEELVQGDCPNETDEVLEWGAIDRIVRWLVSLDYDPVDVFPLFDNWYTAYDLVKFSMPA